MGRDDRFNVRAIRWITTLRLEKYAIFAKIQGVDSVSRLRIPGYKGCYVA